MATRKPHVLLIPHPAQGHVFPMLKLAQKLSDHGITVTVVNLEFIHKKISLQEEGQQLSRRGIRLISVPDGLESPLEAEDPMRKMECLQKVLPIQLRNLLENQESAEEISWVIADAFLFEGAFVVAKEMGIKTVAFWTASMENLALLLRVPQLIDAGIIDDNGFLLNNADAISLSNQIPAWKANELTWNIPGQTDEFQKWAFINLFTNPSQNYTIADNFIVNSFYKLEPSACQLFPDILQIGPLESHSLVDCLPGSFWPQDSSCMSWLAKQSEGSVIYVAFGSITVLSQQQFCELALGLEITGKPFLWVIRANFVKGSSRSDELFPDGFLERVGDKGKIVEWVNQEVVLSHPSTACFLSHCGWNSTLDGLCAGVSFLCWPYFVDQFHNQESICDAWKVGMRLKVDPEIGLVTRLEIASKVKQLLYDDTIRCNSQRFRQCAKDSVNEGGSSFRNFLSLVHNLYT